MSETTEKLVEELKAQEKYKQELEIEFKNTFGYVDEVLFEGYLRARLSIVKNYILNLDRKLQTQDVEDSL